tara:strand:- start:69 stop:1178 length:1110 start_codon:yes stop_codon:yes gene_type:complete
VNNKITFIIGNLGVGGTEKQLFQLLKGLNVLGQYQLIVVLFNKHSHKTIYNDFKRLKCIRLVDINSGSALKKTFFLRNFLKKEKPQIVFSCNFYLNVICYFATYKMLTTNISWIRFLPSNDRLNSFKLGPLLKLAFLWPDVFISNSSIANNLIQKKTANRGKKLKFYKINNGVELSNIEINSKIEKTFVIGYLGRIDKNKNVDMLFHVFSKMSIKNNNIKLVIVGEGQERKNILKLIGKHNLDKYVELHRFTNNPNSFIDQFNILCLPSKAEGLPNVVLEAMSRKCPVIISNVGGNPELLVNGKYGYLFDPNNPDDLYDKLNFARDNKYEINTMAEKAYIHVRKNFSIEKMVENHKNIFDLFLNDNKKI